MSVSEESLIELLHRLDVKGSPERWCVGTFNDVVVVRAANGFATVVRARVREKAFGHETAFMKEPIVSSFITRALPFSVSANDRLLDDVAKAVVGVRCRVCPSPGDAPFSRCMPLTFSYDNTRSSIPHLWLVQSYVEGPLLAAATSDLVWYRVGEALGRLHTLQVARAGPMNRRAVSPEQRIRGLIDYVVQHSPVSLGGEYDIPALSRGAMSLCHGDVHGENIVVADQPVLLDWDNASVDFPELDFVKAKYWSDLDADGFFAPNASFFAAFSEGHLQTYGSACTSERLALYELYWLCKIYRFEQARERSGRLPTRPFPGASAYLKPLAKLADAAGASKGNRGC